MSDLNQKTLVLRHLREKGKISQLQALREYGCMRLAAVIHRLRRDGHKIVTGMRYQGDSQYAVYRLENAEDE